MTTPEPSRRDEPEGFARDVVRSAAVELTSKAVVWIVLTFGAALLVLVRAGGSVPAWTLAPLGLVGVLAVLLSHRRVSGLRRDRTERDRRIAELEPLRERVRELEEANEDAWWSVERHEVYAAHVAEVLDHLQRVVSGDIAVSIPVYIGRGILEPARDVLAHDASPDARLSVLLPDGDDFVMRWAAGHTLPGQTKYRVPIKDTLSRVAYESGELHIWDDVTTDDRFVASPGATRPVRAMISLPLRSGDRVIGVLNAIASQPGVFDPAEAQYLTSLASIISVAVHLEDRGRGWMAESE